MIFEYQTAEEVVRHLRELREDAEARAAAWARVAVRKKKSGEEFAQLARAVDGAEFGKYSPVEDGCHPYLTIFYKVGREYKFDHIPAFFFIDELPEDKRDRAIIYGGVLMRDTSPMRAEELREAISAEVTRARAKAERLKRQEERAEKAFAAYRTAIDVATALLLQTCAECDGETVPAWQRGRNSLYYAITGAKN